MRHYIAPPCHEPLSICYQDTDIIVVEKPSGLLSVPGRLKENSDSVQTRLEKMKLTPTIVHRLDMATSGLMVVALNKEGARQLNEQFRLRSVGKKYEAVCLGRLAEQSGEIDLPIMVDWPNRPKQKIDHENGKSSLTRYYVMSQEQVNETDVNRVELEPITGRSHQLRIHLFAIGHPILGCKFYQRENSLSMAPRLLLHAKQLSFQHPTDSKTMTFESVVPF